MELAELPSVTRFLDWDEPVRFVVVGGVRGGGAREAARWAANRAYALNWVLAGSGTLRAGGDRHALAPGVLYVHHPGRRACIEVDGDGLFEVFLVVDARTAAALRALGMFPEAHALAVGLDAVLAEDWRAFHALCASRDRTLAPHAVTAALCALLDRFLGRSGALASENRLRRAVFDGASLLAGSLAEPPAPCDVAREVGLSYTAFRRAFRKIRGESPVRFRIRMRIRRACELLPDHSVKETAAALGYCDAFTFSRQFRAVIGVSPTAFRAAGLRSAG